MSARAALALSALALFGCRAEPARPPDVVLVLIDTLRADHVGAYGYARASTPTLDAFAARATLFENAVAQAPHTIPSMLQLMTSRYAQGLEIPASDRTLAEVLQAQGYDTLAVVENPNFEQHPTAHGLKRGFRRFYRNGVIDRLSLAQQLYRTNTPADAVTAQALRALRARDRAKPLFLWVHYSDPHDPYLPPFADDIEALSQDSPSPYTGDVRATDVYLKDPPPALAPLDHEHLVALYDAEVRYVDQALGDLFAGLRAEGLERALVVVASDHGESLGEHGVWTHGRSAWEPEIRVPLIVRRPGQTQAERVRAAAELLDVFPTVLDVAGLPADGLRLDGESLFRRAAARPAFVFWKQWQVVRTPEWKLVQAGDGLLLYRVDQDPGEQHDLFATRGDVARTLLAARDERLRGTGASAQELDERSRAAWERLRALGYLAR